MSLKLFSRLSGRLKRKKPDRENEPRGWPEVGEDGLLAEPAEPFPPGDPDGVGNRPTGALARWARRDQTLAKLQEGYEQVGQVIGEIQKQLVDQGDRTERISTSLEQLARAMGDLPDVSRRQVLTLESIAAQLENTSGRTQKLTEIVSELPKVTRAQTDTLAGINRQLEMASEHNVLATQTTEKLGNALDSLGQASASHADAVNQMNTRVNEQNNLLTQLIARQSKRFMMLFIVTIVLAAAAITVAILSLALRG
jgi:CHASE3 domain sensor protein